MSTKNNSITLNSETNVADQDNDGPCYSESCPRATLWPVWAFKSDFKDELVNNADKQERADAVGIQNASEKGDVHRTYRRECRMEANYY